MRNRDLYVIPAKNDVISGIRKVSSLLAKNKIKINRRCVGLIEELGLYAWDEKAARNGEEKPIKEHDHALDALRYYVNSLPMWRIYD
jgi:phage terminase large subunit